MVFWAEGVGMLRLEWANDVVTEARLLWEEVNDFPA